MKRNLLTHIARHKVWWTAGVILVIILGIAVVRVTSRTGTAEPLGNGTVVQAVANVRIREAPSLSAARLSSIPLGANATVMSVDESGQWYQIQYDGVTGWSAGDFFVVVQGSIPTSNRNEAINSPTGVTVRALDGLRIRSLPSLEGERIGGITWGERAALLAIDSSGQWYQINYNGIVGWSAAQYFEIETGNPADVPPVKAISYVRSEGNVNIRQNPSLEAEVIAMIFPGNHAVLRDRSSDGAWYQISYLGQIGWVSAQYFTLDEDYVQPNTTAALAANLSPDAQFTPQAVAAQPTPTAAPTLTPIPAELAALPQPEISSILVQSTSNLVIIRAEPDDAGAPFGVVRGGTEVRLLAIDPTGVWYQVDFAGSIGWVPAASFTSTGDTIPIEHPIPSEAEPSSLPSITPGVFVVNSQTDPAPIMAEPTVSAEKLGEMEPDRRAFLLQVDSTAKWYRVNHNGVVGWVEARFLAEPIHQEEAEVVEETPALPSITPGVFVVNSGADPAPIFKEASTSAEEIGEVAQDGRAFLLQVDDTQQWYRVNHNGIVGWVEARFLAEPVSEEVEGIQPGVFMANLEDDPAPILAEADASAKKLGEVAHNGRAFLLQVDDAWYRVNHNGIVGWVEAKYLVEITDEVRDRLAAEIPTEPEETSVESNGTAVMILAYPDPSADLLGIIRRGERATVLDIDVSGAWYKIDYDGLVGWATVSWFNVKK